jgi:hypothetical protein
MNKGLRARSFALLALLTALLMRAAIPAGYMLAPADGLPQIVPCTGTGPAMPHHGGGHDRHNQGSETPCAFASVAPPALPDAPPLLAPPPAAPLPFAAITAETLAPRLRAILPPPATGPPAA